MLKRGINISYEDVLSDLKTRDSLDMDRELSPLKPASDAVIIDTNNMNLNQVVDNMLKTVIT